MLALLGCWHGVRLSASESRVSITVTINVPTVAQMRVLSETPALPITPRDMQRGYVDVSSPITLNIVSNARAGFAVDGLPMNPLIQSIAVHGIGEEALLGANGGTIVQRWNHPRPTSVALTFRLGLARGFEPGVYPWPIHLAVRPLVDMPEPR